MSCDPGTNGSDAAAFEKAATDNATRLTQLLVDIQDRMTFARPLAVMPRLTEVRSRACPKACAAALGSMALDDGLGEASLLGGGRRLVSSGAAALSEKSSSLFQVRSGELRDDSLVSSAAASAIGRTASPNSRQNPVAFPNPDRR